MQTLFEDDKRQRNSAIDQNKDSNVLLQEAKRVSNWNDIEVRSAKNGPSNSLMPVATDADGAHGCCACPERPVAVRGTNGDAFA